MNAFITGSHVFGKPTKDSDVDLVVLITPRELKLLQKMADVDDALIKVGPSDVGPQFTTHPASSLRFGKLNLIAVTDPIAYCVWAEGTKILKENKDETGEPTTRRLAKYLFESLRRHCGLYKKRPDYALAAKLDKDLADYGLPDEVMDREEEKSDD